MNNTCCGDWFPTLGLYRCLYDGSDVHCTELPPLCPSCNRPIEPDTVTEPKVEQVMAIWIPRLCGGFWWIPQPARPTEKKDGPP